MKRIVATMLIAVAAACRSEPSPDAFGNIEATEVIVGAQASGQLTTFTPMEGQQLAAGAVAALVDTTSLSLQLRQIEAQRTTGSSRVGEVGEQVRVLETQRTIALRAYERTKRLFDQQAATAQQLDQTERDYRTLVAQIAAVHAQERTASADVASTQAHAAQLRDQIQKARVINPVAGTVLATFVKAGEIVQPGQPLYKIAKLDSLELRAYVTETQLSQVKLGQSVRVAIDTGASRAVIAGVVSWVASQAEFTPTPIQTRDERSNLVYAIKVRLANPNGVLKIGMPADVQLARVVAEK